ncbi:MAG: hypothetical protein JWN30_252, partial [Bacilli bacterium]|nr:hypothetical protein [Bacilli bacterium]
MFDATFQDLFRAVDRIEQGLINSDREQRELLTEELSLLRRACDQYMEKWLQFEERVFELCENFDLQIDSGPQLSFSKKWLDAHADEPAAAHSPNASGAASAEQDMDQQFVLPAMASGEAAQLFRSGLGYFDLLLFDQSIEQMEQVLLLNPDLMVARIYLALAYLAKGDHEKCESHLQFVSILEQDPLLLATSASAKAQIAARVGDYEQAIRLFLQALEHEPQLKDIHYNLGVCEWHRQNYKDAIHYLTLAVEIEPGDWQSFQLTARCLLRLGRMQQATEALEKARKLNPAYPPLL